MKLETFFDILREYNVSFFTGVPDSLLKHFISYLDDNFSSDKHIISTNEGSSIGLSIGYHLSTNKIPLIYMQNSGLGNTVNPILSLADKEVYSIPMILLIGWRGEPGIKDEPQHIKQGKVTEEIINAMEIPYVVLDKNSSTNIVTKIISLAKKNSCPVAILVKKDTFEKHISKKNSSILDSYSLSREKVIKLIVDTIDKDDIVISNTGMASRELMEYRSANKEPIKDFLTVGGMGHSSQIALGIALSKKNRNIICIDGDGSLLMHLGSLALIGSSTANNIKHFVINNGVHGSVGNQPTLGFKIDFTKIAKGCGYKNIIRCIDELELINSIRKALHDNEKYFVEIRTNIDARDNLSRPKQSPIKNKKAFTEFIDNK